LKIAVEGTDAGALPSNVAYKDINNEFSADQMISKANPLLTLRDTTQGVDAKNVDIVHTSAQFQIRTINDAYSGVLNQLLAINRIGHVWTSGPMSPGRLDTGWTWQNSWWIAGHGSYGLYCNTGFYVAGNIWTAGVLFPRTYSVSDTTSFGLSSSYDLYIVNAISSGVTISGTAGAYDGHPVIVRLRDNGAARPIAYGGNFHTCCGVAMPTSTAPNRVIHMGFRWNAYYGTWQMIAVSQE
jgi:hypothetical protein